MVFIAIDAHKHYVVLGGLNAHVESMLLPRMWHLCLRKGLDNRKKR